MASITEFDPVSSSYDIFIKLNSLSIESGEFDYALVPAGYILYKGMDVPCEKIKDYDDPDNNFASTPSWFAGPEVCYGYAIRSLNQWLQKGVTPSGKRYNRVTNYEVFLPDEAANIFAYTVTKPVKLFNLLSRGNAEKLMVKVAENYIMETDPIVKEKYMLYFEAIRIATGFSLPWKALKDKFPEIMQKRGLSHIEYFLDKGGGKTKYVYKDTAHSEEEWDINRVSFMEYDKLLVEALAKFVPRCSGYWGYTTPSLYHLKGVFHTEVCIINPSLCMKLDRNDRLSTCKDRTLLKNLFQKYGINRHTHVSIATGSSEPTIMTNPVQGPALLPSSKNDLSKQDTSMDSSKQAERFYPALDKLIPQLDNPHFDLEKHDTPIEPTRPVLTDNHTVMQLLLRKK